MPSIEVVRPGSAVAALIVRAYTTDVASRWYGRQATAVEVDQALRDEPYDDLQGDTGVLYTAMEGGSPIACAGVRFTAEAAELTKVFTLPVHRGRGASTLLLDAVQRACLARGIDTLRLDTRAELAEACALYERLGFVQVAAFNDEPYSDRWYSKTLGA